MPAKNKSRLINRGFVNHRDRADAASQRTWRKSWWEVPSPWMGWRSSAPFRRQEGAAWGVSHLAMVVRCFSSHSHLISLSINLHLCGSPYLLCQMTYCEHYWSMLSNPHMSEKVSFVTLGWRHMICTSSAWFSASKGCGVAPRTLSSSVSGKTVSYTASPHLVGCQ